MKSVLARIVGGLTVWFIEFDGPATAMVGQQLYVTLCSHGVKPQGGEAPSFGWQEAIERYEEQLRMMLAENRDRQLAWRARPELICDGEGKYHVYSRLAFL